MGMRTRAILMSVAMNEADHHAADADDDLGAARPRHDLVDAVEAATYEAREDDAQKVAEQKARRREDDEPDDFAVLVETG